MTDLKTLGVARALVLLLLALAASEATTAEGEALNQAHAVSFGGAGPIRIGMTLAEVRQAAGVRITVEPEVIEGCTFAYPESAPPGISFMLIEGVVARCDVREPGFRTFSGAQVGDTEARVKALYRGRYEVSPHTYTDGHYITVYSRNRSYALVFETDGTVVTSFRIGRVPEALFIEGCA